MVINGTINNPSGNKLNSHNQQEHINNNNSSNIKISEDSDFGYKESFSNKFVKHFFEEHVSNKLTASMYQTLTILLWRFYDLLLRDI